MNKELNLDLVCMVQRQYYNDKQEKIMRRNIKVSCICLIIFILSCFLSFLIYNVCVYEVPAEVIQETKESYKGSANIVQEVLCSNNIDINPNYIVDIDYLAHCIEAEAGDQGELGKRLVVDVILNRCDKYDMDTTDIINAKGQFEVVSNGSINRVTPTTDIYDIIAEELVERYNTEIIYFREDFYHPFGTPIMSYKNHYFSK